MGGRFQDKVVLVTAGGAGIGAATAEAFAREGAKVMCSDINEERGAAVLKKLRDLGADVRFRHADVTREQDMADLVKATVDELGGLDIAANVVGDAHPDAAGPEFHKQSLEGWEWTIALTLRSVFLSMKHEIAYMIEHGGGSICNVTSLAGFLYVPQGGMAYGAGKAGVIRATKFAAMTYADRGVRVNCIAPGITITASYDRMTPEDGQRLVDEMMVFPAIKRVLTPAEQAAGIVWLCSEEASMITGHVLPIDGGWTARGQ
ncbi:SDR family oxidoreductase [Sphingobium sp. Sx8-8]|uniref:SDR family NAD(P)-dependent oxidoreductase n=1 Tax=Sphingobium sp. Sx8-8 TaxID=2933617 RepID=UPI001F589CFF|nr:SDR family oxidoreductase [Sphingobium sp. Sx8-8]